MTWNRAWPVDVDGQVAQLVDDQQPGAAYRAQLRVEPAPMPSQTLGDKLRRVYDEIDEWRSRPLESEYPYVFVDGVWHKRSWGGSVENAGILVAIGVDPEGHREVIGVAGGMREDAAGWEQSVRGMIERGLKVVRLVVGDRCAGARRHRQPPCSPRRDAGGAWCTSCATCFRRRRQATGIGLPRR